MTPTNKISGAEGCGFFIAYIMFLYLVMAVVVAVAWNVGLYGAGLVDNKIGFWTALGLSAALNVLRYVLGGARTNKVNNVFAKDQEVK